MSKTNQVSFVTYPPVEGEIDGNDGLIPIRFVRNVISLHFRDETRHLVASTGRA